MAGWDILWSGDHCWAPQGLPVHICFHPNHAHLHSLLLLLSSPKWRRVKVGNQVRLSHLASSSPSPPGIIRKKGFPYLSNQFLPIQLGASCSLPRNQPKLLTAHNLETELLNSGIVLLSFYLMHISLFWPNVLSLSLDVIGFWGYHLLSS